MTHPELAPIFFLGTSLQVCWRLRASGNLRANSMNIEYWCPMVSIWPLLFFFYSLLWYIPSHWEFQKLVNFPEGSPHAICVHPRSASPAKPGYRHWQLPGNAAPTAPNYKSPGSGERDGPHAGFAAALLWTLARPGPSSQNSLRPQRVVIGIHISKHSGFASQQFLRNECPSNGLRDILYTVTQVDISITTNEGAYRSWSNYSRQAGITSIHRATLRKAAKASGEAAPVELSSCWLTPCPNFPEHVQMWHRMKSKKFNFLVLVIPTLNLQ